MKHLTLLLSLAGLALAAPGDTARKYTMGYSVDTCNGNTVCRYSQVKLSSSSGGAVDSATTLVTNPTLRGTTTYIGTGGGTPSPLSGAVLQSYGTRAGYLQNNIQNLSTDTAASSDWVATANNGTDSTGYVDLGVNGGGFSQGKWTVNGGGDGYLYAQSGGMAVGTATAGKPLVLFTGGSLATNARLTITDSSLIASKPVIVRSTLDALNVKRNNPKRILVLGDSISGDLPTGNWAENASIILNGEFFVSWNIATGGATLDNMRNIQIPSIPAWVKYDEVWIQGGTNNPGITTSNVNAVNGILAWALAHNVRPVFYGIPPYGSAAPNLNSSSDWNTWLLAWCRYNSVEYRYIWQDAVDPATGYYLAAASLDNTHPRRAYTLKAAQQLAELLHPGSTSGHIPFYDHIYFNKTTADSVNLITNPLNFLSTGGISTGVSYTVSSALDTNAVVAIGAPYIGNSQQSRGTVAAGGYVYCKRDFNVPAGHRIRVSQYLALPTMTESVELNEHTYIWANRLPNDGSTLYYGMTNLCPGNAGIYVMEFVMPAGSTGVHMLEQIAAGNAGNTITQYDFRTYGEFKAVDLTALGLDN